MWRAAGRSIACACTDCARPLLGAPRPHCRTLRVARGALLCSGIGLETARALALAGAHVVLCCRTASKAHALIERWADEAGEQGVSCEVGGGSMQG